MAQCQRIQNQKTKTAERRGMTIGGALVLAITVGGLLLATNTPNARRASCELAKQDKNAGAVVRYCDYEVHELTAINGQPVHELQIETK